ncbi:MAG: phage baseplate assembly protein [Ruminococcus sp.]|nr:phage baseplate assembly protein [Ruminococcus sp.]
MWLTSFINKEKAVQSATKGSITSSQAESLQVDSSTQHRDVSVVAPYGIAYVPPVGEGAVVVPFEGGEACVGVLSKVPLKLSRGELMLYSAGGASIVLKNDGSVLINGEKVGD